MCNRKTNKPKLKHMKTAARSVRGSRGNVLLIFIALIAATVVVMLASLKVGQAAIASQRSLSAAEAASLAAAKDLSAIVVNDPYYGFVSLSDYPAYGKATFASDGEPVNVTGINTIMGTARLQMIIADQIGNDELKRLAQQDVQAAKHAAQQLSDALAASVNQRSIDQAFDLEGNRIRPIEHAKQVFLTNASSLSAFGKVTLKDFRMSLGWLRDGSNSNTQIPQPENLSDTPTSARVKGNYRAFVEVPAGSDSFYFAGLAPTPSLVDPSQFMQPDGKRFCSIIKVDADVVIANEDQRSHSRVEQLLHSSASAEPFSMPDRSTPGLFAISFKHGFVPGIDSIQDIMNNDQLNANKVNVMTAEGGDVPNDATAKLWSGPDGDSVKTISQAFATGLHDWLRTAHNKPRIDSILQIAAASFEDSAQAGSGSKSYPNLFYDVDSNGYIHINNPKQNPFYSPDVIVVRSPEEMRSIRLLRLPVYDKQNYAVSFAAMSAGSYSWLMVYRNYSRTLGTALGGKHAGQALPGDAVNWCELAKYDGCSEQAVKMGKGEQALHLTACGQLFDENAIALNGCYFIKQDGAPLSQQPRRNQYSGGLAAYFELSSPMH